MAFVILLEVDFRAKATQEVSQLNETRKYLFDNFIVKISSKFDMSSDFLTTLRLMSTFFQRNTSDPSMMTSSDVITNSPVVPYTGEEELWLMNQFTLIEQAFRSLAVDEKMIQEFMLIPFGVFPPMEHTSKMFSIFLQRIFRVYDINADFEEMMQDQSLRTQLIIRNSPLVLALLAAKADNCTTFNDQIRVGLGELDDSRWNEHYMPMLEACKEYPATTIKGMLEKSPSLLVDCNLASYVDLTDSLAILTNDPWMFKAAVLLTMTLPDSADFGANPLHNKYVTVLGRRLQCVQPLTSIVETRPCGEILQ